MSSPATNSSSSIDIAIIGGGVAGSSAAIVLQRAGYSVAIVERESVFRDRVRGEACHPWGVKELIELDLKPFVDRAGGVELPRWARYKQRELEMSFEWGAAYPGTPPELGFSHPKLQESLLQGAIDTGVQVHRPASVDIARHTDGWLLQIQEDETATSIHASFLIAADGKTSSTRKLWGGESLVDPPHHQFGGMLVRGIDLPQDTAHQGYHENGFSMVFPQGDEMWRLYYVCSTEEARQFTGEQRLLRYMEACAATLPVGALDKAEPAGPLAFFPNSHAGATRIHGSRAVAIGDAAGAGDPSQGHGMSLVWRDVRLLRDLLASHGFEDAPEAFAKSRRVYEHVLRTHATWVAPLTVALTDEDQQLQEQVDLARAEDGSALGYTAIFANGPDNLPTDDATRSRFFGEHLTQNPVENSLTLDKYE